MHEEKSRGSGLESRKTRLEATGKRTREVAAATARGKPGRHASSDHGRCKIGLVELLRDRSRRSWVVPNVPSPKQTRNSERKFGKNAKNPVKRERVERWLCTVDWLSDRDHLSTGKSEGYEGPFERDGMTRQGRGAKWHA
ncbi:hypothetical protein CRG98_037165 [Punica granatum]|uniref:Uncharacterized protein n=1 Tax=Punica granatum TaxID=22663 RepID=A0A2I0IEK0_PUNGR|nr:hypothetical protein CRG98_037165 [Punica granatum]